MSAACCASNDQTFSLSSINFFNRSVFFVSTARMASRDEHWMQHFVISSLVCENVGSVSTSGIFLLGSPCTGPFFLLFFCRFAGLSSILQLIPRSKKLCALVSYLQLRHRQHVFSFGLAFWVSPRSRRHRPFRHFFVAELVSWESFCCSLRPHLLRLSSTLSGSFGKDGHASLASPRLPRNLPRLEVPRKILHHIKYGSELPLQEMNLPLTDSSFSSVASPSNSPSSSRIFITPLYWLIGILHDLVVTLCNETRVKTDAMGIISSLPTVYIVGDPSTLESHWMSILLHFG